MNMFYSLTRFFMDMNTLTFTCYFKYIFYFAHCKTNMINYQIILAMIKKQLLPNLNKITIIIDCEDEIIYLNYFKINSYLIQFTGMFY